MFAPDHRKALSNLLRLLSVPAGTMRGVIEKIAWEEMTDLTRVVRPVALMLGKRKLLGNRLLFLRYMWMTS